MISVRAAANRQCVGTMEGPCMSDHVADIKKYTTKPVDEAAVARLAKTYQLEIGRAHV